MSESGDRGDPRGGGRTRDGAGDTVVLARDVTRVYRQGRTRVRALRGATVTVAKGDFLAVTGPSGSGKSTLLHLLGGVDVPTSGEVLFLSRDLGRLSVEERAAQGGGAVPDDLVRTLEAELDAVRPELERYVKGAAGAPERSGG